MSTITGSRRRQRRHGISDGHKTSCVEFVLNGKDFRLPLTNVSASGVSFRTDLEEGPADLDEGTDLPQATVRMGDCLIRGDLVVMHVTPDAGTSHICGALFYPSTDTDLVKLKGVLAGLEAAARK